MVNKKYILKNWFGDVASKIDQSILICLVLIAHLNPQRIKSKRESNLVDWNVYTVDVSGWGSIPGQSMADSQLGP